MFPSSSDSKKNLPAIQETQGWSLGWKDSLEKGESSILAWRTSWTEEPGGLQSKGSQTVRHDWVTNTQVQTHTHTHTHTHTLSWDWCSYLRKFTGDIWGRLIKRNILLKIISSFLNFYFIFNWKIIILLWWFLPYINMNQPQAYICPLPLKLPCHLPPHPTLLDCHRAPVRGSHWLFPM